MSVPARSVFLAACLPLAAGCLQTDPDDRDSVAQEVNGTYRLKLVHSGKCVDVAGGTGATQNGVDLHQWTCHTGTNQQWRMQDLGGGVHQLQAVHSGKCMDVSGGTSAVQNGRILHQWTCHGAANQRFRLVARGSGQYQLVAQHSGKCLDVQGGSTTNGAVIHQWSCHSGGNQRVTLEPITGDDPDDDGGLTWHTANLTWFTSYPDPGSEECLEYNGCKWAGWFAALPEQMPESWVAANNIAAVHSDDFATYRLKTLRIRQGSRQIDAKVYDMCSDSDCNGCCTANSSSTGFLIDLESYTADRFGAYGGVVEWTCLDC